MKSPYLLHKFCKVASAVVYLSCHWHRPAVVLQFRIVPCTLQWFYSFSQCIPNSKFYVLHMKNWFCLTVEEFRFSHRTTSEQAGRKCEIAGVWLPLDLRVKYYSLGDRVELPELPLW